MGEMSKNMAGRWDDPGTEIKNTNTEESTEDILKEIEELIGSNKEEDDTDTK